MTENTCYTHFKITGHFNPDIVAKRLGLIPNKTRIKEVDRYANKVDTLPAAQMKAQDGITGSRCTNLRCTGKNNV